MLHDVGHRLRLARLGAAALAEVPGAVLRVGRRGGDGVTVGPLGDARATVLPCQHRAALLAAVEAGSLLPYLCTLGLTRGGELTVELVPPTGADLGSGVLVAPAPTGDADRRLVVATTLCPHRATVAVRDPRTVPQAARQVRLGSADEASAVLAGLRTDLRWDRELHVTVLGWTHRPHPAVSGLVEDAVRAAAASCAVGELVSTL